MRDKEKEKEKQECQYPQQMLSLTRTMTRTLMISDEHDWSRVLIQERETGPVGETV
jgi:hypothetical protein